MKNFRNTLLLAIGLLIGFTAYGQQKIGHINSQELLSLMPEADSAQKRLEKIARDHELTLEELSVEFNKKYEEYLTNQETYSDLKRATKEAELEEAQKRIQTFEQTAQRDLQQKRAELFQPVQEKALNAVNEVAADNNFTYVFDSGVGVLVYTGDSAIDIMPLVKQKLGLE